MGVFEFVAAMIGSGGFAAAVSGFVTWRVAMRKATLSEQAIEHKAIRARQAQIDDASNNAIQIQAKMLEDASNRLAAESRRADDNQRKYLEAELRTAKEREQAAREKQRADDAERRFEELKNAHDENAKKIEHLEALIESCVEKIAAVEQENGELREQLQRYAGVRP